MHRKWITVPGLVLIFLLCACNLNSQPSESATTLESTTPVASPDSDLSRQICQVVPDQEQATVWGEGGASLALLEGRIDLVSVADNAYIVEVSPGVQGWVSAMEAHLEGAACPGQSTADGLPLIGHPGLPSPEQHLAGCFVVRDTTVNKPASVYYGAADAFAPIAVLDGYADLVQAWNGGYEISVPQYDRNVWIRDGIHLEGTGCPGMPSEHSATCLPVLEEVGRPVITPSEAQSETCVKLLPGRLVVTWPEAPANFEMLEFWRMNENGMTDVIGVDNNPADGASITWDVFETMPPSVVFVFAYGGNSSGNSGQLAVYVGRTSP